MVYVDVIFAEHTEVETKEFLTPYNALRFMYMCRNKNHLVMGYRADDPYDTRWLERRFRL